METVEQEDSAPNAPPSLPVRSSQKSGPPSFHINNRSQEREKANNVAVGGSTKGDQHQVGDGGSKRKRGDRKEKGGGEEKGVKS